jgi:glycosyltransferase involved in cell wall biosynthesis
MGALKVIIQIPCFNEEAALPVTLGALPRQLPGVGTIEWLVIDDGSSDRTCEVARQCGIDHLIRLPVHRGLAAAFTAGLEACLRAGADIVVNTDADNQYRAQDIPKLIEPILRGEAEIVVGARPIGAIEHFSPAKKLMQRLGSLVVRLLTGTGVQDTPSGFRAITRAAALRLQTFSTFSYTQEMIIGASIEGIPIASVPVGVNPKLRESRLAKSSAGYIFRQALTIARMFAIYRPFEFFAALGAVPFSAGSVLWARWLWLRLFHAASYHPRIPSLVAAAVLLLLGFQLWIFAFVADLLAVNRRILELNRLHGRLQELRSAPGENDALVRAEFNLRQAAEPSCPPQNG